MAKKAEKTKTVNETISSEDVITGKIIKGIGGFYYVAADEQLMDIYECKARGVFRKEGITPLVGDDVRINVLPDKKGNIIEILQRKSALIRPAASNADQAVMIFALKKPAINTGLLDSFLVNTCLQGLETVIAFSKSDMGDTSELEAIYKSAGYKVISFSNITGEGIPEIIEILRNKTSIISGPSGVGKSSLINSLLGYEYAETGELSEKLGRGRNTTRHTELIRLEPGTYIMDTPGYSSIETICTEEGEVQYGFKEMEKYIGTCKFTGCRHISEPGCPVKQAVEEGQISTSRYESYKDILQSVAQK